MERYRNYLIPPSTGYLGDNGRWALCCNECGVDVLDRSQHDAFHDRLDGIGKTAKAADRTAAMFRPIG